jgi:hypothetical protein
MIREELRTANCTLGMTTWYCTHETENRPPPPLHGPHIIKPAHNTAVIRLYS